MNENYSGTVRIKNPKTLKRWIRLGWYQKTLDEGFVFNVGCGRFTPEKCTCHMCRTRGRPKLKAVLQEHEVTDELFEIWAFADWQDKSTEWMLQMMADKVDIWDASDAVQWIQRNSNKRNQWYKDNPDWYKKYEQ